MSLKNRVRIGSAIDKELYNQLKKLSTSTRINMSRLLDEAIDDLINKYEQNKRG